MAPQEREIVIQYCPRNWAESLHDARARWAVLVLHRRAGKNTCLLNHHQRAALDDQWELMRLRALLPDRSDADLTPRLRQRIYWPVMPSYEQDKRVRWDA